MIFFNISQKSVCYAINICDILEGRMKRIQNVRQKEGWTEMAEGELINAGYVQVADMKLVGKKFDRWYDLLWYQKRIWEEPILQ